jgi:methylmalonyl-CoA mutase cobalamin-binding domain/chain
MAAPENIAELVRKGRLKTIGAAVDEALREGVLPDGILSAMIGVMTDVGDGFQRGELFLPEIMASALTMKKGVEMLRPLLAGGGAAARGKIIIGTVSGDLHDIGKNLVALMLESAGFQVLDLGVDVPPARFIETVRAHPDCRLVGLSTLLTTTMGSMRETVAALTETGLRSRVMILVGGAPVTEAYAAEIGADAYAPDAAAAARAAESLTARVSRSPASAPSSLPSMVK